MDTLTDWTAKRAGGRITVNGTDLKTGHARKVVGIDKIWPASALPGAFARDKNGVDYFLATARG